MKYLSTLLVFLVLATGNLFAARNTSAIKGIVIDKETRSPLSYATLAVRDSSNSVITAATAGSDGAFTLEGIPYGLYQLVATFIGYKEQSRKIELTSAQTDVGFIEMEEDVQTLETAVITARVPVIEQKIDKIVMNVAEAVSTEGSNALEVLRKAPGVTIDMDGNVKLNGQAVSVWIDGRPSYLSGLELEALLRSTDGTTIDKIELMAHPSAKYDAEGSGGIINIKMKKNLLKGFSGTANGYYGGMKHKRYEQEAGGGLNMNLRTDKTNTMLNYSGRYDNIGVQLDTRTIIGDATSFEQISHSDFLIGSQSHTVKLANDIFLNKKNTVGFIVTTMFRGQSQDNYGDDNLTTTKLNGNLISSMNSIIRTNTSYDNVTANVNYTGVFNEEKSQELTFNADYAYYDIMSGNYQNNSIVSGFGFNEIFRQNSQQFINLVSGKIDYQQSFWKTGMLEAGLKWAMTQTNNDLFREDSLTGGWIPNTNMSNEFLYTEHIAAAYASVGRMLGNKWTLKLGLRGEYTYALGDWITTKKVTTKNYFNLFPTVFVGYNPSANWRLNLSYTSRIGRPSFSQLNPFRNYIDANSYVEGNPDLDSQLSRQMALSVTFKNHYNLALIYAHTRNLIMQDPYYDETGTKILLWENFGNQYMLGGSLSVSELPVTEWLYFTLSGVCVYMGNTSNPTNGQNEQYINNGVLSSVQGQLTFLLPKDWKIELMGVYQGKVPYGYFTVKPIFMMNGGVKKNFMNNKATLSINVNDIFGTFDSNLVYKSEDNVDYSIDQSINLQKIRLSLSIRFGQGKAARARKVGDLEEASRVDTSGGISTGTTGTLP